MGSIDIDAQYLAEKGLEILAVAERVASAPAIPEADIEKTVGAESELSALMVVKRLVYRKKHPFGRGVRLIRSGRGNRKLRYDGLQLPGDPARVVHEEPAACCEAGVEGKPQKPLLSARL